MMAKRLTGRILTAKRSTSIATWNVRTLYTTGKLENAIKTMKDYKISILGLCETRWTGHGKIVSGGQTFIYSGGDEHLYGVGILLDPPTSKALLTWEPISERILTARFQTHHTTLTIVQIYAPTNVIEDEKKENFYHQLQDVVNTIPKHDVIIVMGDFNAHIPENRGSFRETIGPFGTGVENDNGSRMLEFCASNQLKIMNTFFKHKLIHKMTHTSPDGYTQNELDFICVNKRWASSVQDVKARRGADIGSDHELVQMNFKLKLKAIPKKIEKTRPIDINKLKTVINQTEYRIEISNRFDALQEIECIPNDVEQQWDMFKTVMIESAEKSLGRRRGNRKEAWISDQTWNLIDKRKKAKKKILQRGDTLQCHNDPIYKELDKEVKKSARKDKETWFDNKINEAQDAATKNDTRTTYRILRDLTNSGPGNKHTPIKGNDGKTLQTQTDIEERWIEHFKKVLNQPQPNSTIQIDEQDIDLDIQCGPITIEEIQTAVNKLKNNKAPGADGIHPEMLKEGGHEVTTMLQIICNNVWTNEIAPKDWTNGTIITLPKKGDLSNCSNWRGITLLSLPSKVLCHIILARIKEKVDILLRDEQSGFRSNRSCTDAIFGLKNIIERSNENNLPLFIHFVDFQKAFDSVHRESLWKILKLYGIPQKIINVIKAIYQDTECTIRLGETTTKPFEIVTGVRQGCVLSPFLFSLIIDYTMTRLEDKGYGIQITEGKRLFDLDFADDIALICDKEEDLQKCTKDLIINAEKVGLRLNAKKCETMTNVSGFTPLQINEDEVKTTQYFTYLGSNISHKGDVHREIRVRLGKANSAFGKLTKILNSKEMKLQMKIRIYKTIVVPILLYGSETWQMYVDDSRRLNAFHQRCLRRILGITYKDRVKNEEILKMTNETAMTDIIQDRRLRWLGHVLRMSDDRFPRKTLNWLPTGKRSRGRPRLTWRNTVGRDLRNLGIGWDEAPDIASNRHEWRRRTARCVNSSTGGTKV